MSVPILNFRLAMVLLLSVWRHTLTPHELKYHGENNATYLMCSSRLESGFSDVECFIILYIVMSRKMRLSCAKAKDIC